MHGAGRGRLLHHNALRRRIKPFVAAWGAVTPGQNAFATRAAEADAHRLRGDAFYQQATAVEDMRRQDQEVAGRLDLTPPTVVHQALR